MSWRWVRSDLDEVTSTCQGCGIHYYGNETQVARQQRGHTLKACSDRRWFVAHKGAHLLDEETGH